MDRSRNAPCPCGSGRKYKRCCLAAAQDRQRTERCEDEVGERIPEWSTQTLGSEFDAALDQFLATRTGESGDTRTLSDTDVELFSAWFHSDRPLSDGRTPAQRYAMRPELGDAERAAATRIASARLGIHRVIDVRPGDLIVVEDLSSGVRATVASAKVSREAMRWDLLIGRLMGGDRPRLWGPVRVLAPSDEADLMAEISRLGGGSESDRGAKPDGATIAMVLETHPLEVARFRPPNWDVKPTFYTLEGDLLAEACASWQMHDPRAVAQRIRAFGHLHPSDEPVLDITVPRDKLIRERGELPHGALVFETASDQNLDAVPIASLSISGDRLKLEAMSERRLHRAIAIVNGDFGDLVGSPELDVVSIEQRLAEPSGLPAGHDAGTESGVDEATERRLLEHFQTDRMRRWIDDPNPRLGGQTPRQAAHGARRDDVVSLVRAVENGAERASRRGQPGPDLSWLRIELGIEDHIAA